MDTTKKLPTVLSLCTGYGGIERGLELAGLEHRVIAHVEIEAFCAANLVNKMEDGIIPPAPLYTNLKTLPVQPFRNRVDILTAGYPCQPFSAAGKRLGEEDPRHLWPYIRGHIESIRPVRCFFENVEGHISLGLREVISDLESLGYRTAFGIFSAREVGAPHQRKRVYIMGDSESGRLSRWTKDSEREGSKNLGERSDQDLRCQSQRSGQALADAVDEGSQGSSQCRPDTREAETGTQSAHGNVGCLLGVSRNIWPSRPGQDQYSWEASRTLEPRLGRAIDGASDRVDRVRALGNGVVPQTAAKAWQILGEKL